MHEGLKRFEGSDIFSNKLYHIPAGFQMMISKSAGKFSVGRAFADGQCTEIHTASSFVLIGKYRFAGNAPAGRFRQKEKHPHFCECFVLALSIFAASHPATIVDASELNFCVRDGNRWTLRPINTNFFRACTLKTEHSLLSNYLSKAL